MFITTVEFLPLHDNTTSRSVEIITRGRSQGTTRMVEMTAKWPENLEKIITPWRRRGRNLGRFRRCDLTTARGYPRGEAAERAHPRRKPVQAIRQLDRTGAVVTFESVAESAGVSRSWLYDGQADLRVEIERSAKHSQDALGRSQCASERPTPRSSPGCQAALGQCRKLAEGTVAASGSSLHALGERRVLSSEGQRFKVAAAVALR